MKIRVRAGIVAVALVCASGCRIDQNFSGGTKPRLGFIGDSITAVSARDINAHYGSTYDVAIHATDTEQTQTADPAVDVDSAAAPAIEIINLGTYDAAFGIPSNSETLSQVLNNLFRFGNEFPASTCVIFVTVFSHNENWNPGWAGAINAYLQETFPHIVEWDNAYQASYYDGTAFPNPNEAGRQALLALEDTAISGCTAST